MHIFAKVYMTADTFTNITESLKFHLAPQVIPVCDVKWSV